MPSHRTIFTSDRFFYRKVQLIASAFEKQPFLQAGGAGWHAQEEVREDVCVCVCGGVSVGGCGVSWHTHSLYQKIQKSHPVVGIVSMGWAWAFRPLWATEALIIYLADTENYSNWSVNTPTQICYPMISVSCHLVLEPHAVGCEDV